MPPFRGPENENPSVYTTYLLMLMWLEGYAYHIDLEWFRFVLPGAGIMVLAIVTISVQVIQNIHDVTHQVAQTRVVKQWDQLLFF